MMNLKQLATAANITKPNHSICIYGQPKTGKTKLVGTAAEIPEVKRIFWFDGENGIETLLHMGLSPEAMEKIIPFKIPDTRESPRFIETMLKALSSKTPVNICHIHGKVNCVECKAPEQYNVFCLKECTHNDLVVIDSDSQLGDSALNLAMLGKDITYKATFDDYGNAGKYLGDIHSVIQACQNTNFICVSHELVIEDEFNGVKRDKIFPLIGTRNFSQKAGKYFGTIIYMEKKMGKHIAGSSSTYKPDTIVGSRVNVKMELNKEGPDMRDILILGGILT